MSSHFNKFGVSLDLKRGIFEAWGCANVDFGEKSWS